MSNILLPKRYVELTEDRRSIFLLGPIKDAPQWQDEATRIILREHPKAVVINPRREVSSDLTNYVINSQVDRQKWARQRAWELDYLERTIKGPKSCGMFWLPARESNTLDVAYAGTTRVEWGEVLTERKYNPDTRFCVGGQESFPNFDIMVYDLNRMAPEKIVYKTLEETVKEAIRISSQ